MSISERDFGRLEGKVDEVLRRLGRIEVDHDDRLRELENTNQHRRGQHSVIAMLSGLLGGGIAAVAQHFLKV